MDIGTVSLEFFDWDGDDSPLVRVRVGTDDTITTLRRVLALKDFLGALSHDQLNDICLNPDNYGYVAEIRNPTAVKAIT